MGSVLNVDKKLVFFIYFQMQNQTSDLFTQSSSAKVQPTEIQLLFYVSNRDSIKSQFLSTTALTEHHEVWYTKSYFPFYWSIGLTIINVNVSLYTNIHNNSIQCSKSLAKTFTHSVPLPLYSSRNRYRYSLAVYKKNVVFLSCCKFFPRLSHYATCQHDLVNYNYWL